MNLLDLKNLSSPPLPFTEHDNIPWQEPEFSRRMLNEHLDQSHNLASRNVEIIDAQVDFLHTEILEEKPSKILDLGCGPGLYSTRLASLGHRVTGIDISPASIEYARKNSADGLKYTEGDIRTTGYDKPFDFVMLLFGEFNVFRKLDIETILKKINDCLVPEGTALFEISSPEAIRSITNNRPSFTFREHGLFHEGPHLLLEEAVWHEFEGATATRYTVIDILANSARQYGASYQSYIDVELNALFSGAGFSNPSLTKNLGIDAGFDGFIATVKKTTN